MIPKNLRDAASPRLLGAALAVTFGRKKKRLGFAEAARLVVSGDYNRCRCGLMADC
ncbi:MAG: hypothetical protein ACLPWS_02830 [Rhodomicrobium sp.]